jgi:DNA topoisomerase I
VLRHTGAWGKQPYLSISDNRIYKSAKIFIFKPNSAVACSKNQTIVEVNGSPMTTEVTYIDAKCEGYIRRRCGKGFIYLDLEGKRVSDRMVVERIRRLVIPPAWTDVRIALVPQAHLQATGRDSRGRKQYIYHPSWEELRNSAKYDLLVPFGSSLASIREQVARDISRPALARETVLAFAVRLLDHTLLRIGNREYARLNNSYGLTTLRDYHVSVSGKMLQLNFRGKGGKPHVKKISDRRLARLARQYQELPGQELLQYRNQTGELVTIASQDVNGYLKQIGGQDFTAKHFRTWGGTVSAAMELVRLGPAASTKEAARKINMAMRRTAARLGNTAAICRKYYVHPVIIDAFQDNTLFELMAGIQAETALTGLSSEEEALLALLKTQGV